MRLAGLLVVWREKEEGSRELSESRRQQRKKKVGFDSRRPASLSLQDLHLQISSRCVPRRY